MTSTRRNRRFRWSTRGVEFSGHSERVRHRLHRDAGCGRPRERRRCRGDASPVHGDPATSAAYEHGIDGYASGIRDRDADHHRRISGWHLSRTASRRSDAHLAGLNPSSVNAAG